MSPTDDKTPDFRCCLAESCGRRFDFDATARVCRRSRWTGAHLAGGWLIGLSGRVSGPILDLVERSVLRSLHVAAILGLNDDPSPDRNMRRDHHARAIGELRGLIG
jgi:hypothetical protein